MLLDDFFLYYRWGKILKRMVVYSFFGRMLKQCFAFFVYLSFIFFLLSNIFLVGMYFVMNEIPIILCFISVIGNVCSNGLFRSWFCSIVLVGTREI